MLDKLLFNLTHTQICMVQANAALVNTALKAQYNIHGNNIAQAFGNSITAHINRSDTTQAEKDAMLDCLAFAMATRCEYCMGVGHS